MMPVRPFLTTSRNSCMFGRPAYASASLTNVSMMVCASETHTMGRSLIQDVWSLVFTISAHFFAFSTPPFFRLPQQIIAAAPTDYISAFSTSSIRCRELFVVRNMLPTALIGFTEVFVAAEKAPLNLKQCALRIAAAKDAQNRDEAFMVFNVGRVVAKWRQWQRAFPRVHAFYAVKCNDAPAILHVLAKLGAGFDCASVAEMDSVLNVLKLVGPDKVIFANTTKSRTSLRFAAQNGVKLMTFGHEEELDKIQEEHKNAEVLLRVEALNLERVRRVGMKFSCEPNVEAARLLRVAADRKIPVVGIAIHINDPEHVREPQAIANGIRHARRLFDIGCDLGHRMTILDIGGGFPGVDTEQSNLDSMAKRVNPMLDKLFPATGGYSIMAEPGRFFVRSAGAVVAHVDASIQMSANEITNNDDDKDKTAYAVYLNEGIFGCFNVVAHKRYQPKGEPLADLVASGKVQEEFLTRIWGPTCDANDKVEDSTRMRRVQEGEWLFYPDMGAYSTTGSTTFNGFPKAEVHFVVDKTTLAELT